MQASKQGLHFRRERLLHTNKHPIYLSRLPKLTVSVPAFRFFAPFDPHGVTVPLPPAPFVSVLCRFVPEPAPGLSNRPLMSTRPNPLAPGVFVFGLVAMLQPSSSSAIGLVRVPSPALPGSVASLIKLENWTRSGLNPGSHEGVAMGGRGSTAWAAEVDAPAAGDIGGDGVRA